MNDPKYTNLSFTAKLSGSTGAELFKNKSGKKWVVKKATLGGGFEQTKYEGIADDIYQLLGVPVPKHKLDITNKALILEYSLATLEYLCFSLFKTKESRDLAILGVNVRLSVSLADVVNFI